MRWRRSLKASQVRVYLVTPHGTARGVGGIPLDADAGITHLPLVVTYRALLNRTGLLAIHVVLML